MKQTKKLQRNAKRGLGAIWKDKKRSEAEGYHRRQTKRRQSGNDAGPFLKEKTAGENQFRAEELALKKQQLQEAARRGQIFAIMQQ